jgi:hypothetical protein
MTTIWALALSAFACLVLGSIGLFEYFRKRLVVTPGREWRSARGRITSSEIVSIMAPSESSKKPEPAFEWQVEFDYEWRNQKFTSRKFGIDTQPRSQYRERLVEYTQQYKPGQNVSVFVNPDYPDSAVLKLSSGNVLLTLSVLCLIAALVLGGWISWEVLQAD